MIGHYQHSRRLIGESKQLPNFIVHFLVVVVNCILELIAGLIEAMRWIHVIPKCMVNSIHTHFYHHKKIPIFLCKKMAGDLKTLSGHLINVSQDLGLVAGAKIPHIQNILSNHAGNFIFELGRMCVIAADVGGQKVADQQAIEWSGWIRSWHADDNRTLPTSREDIPHSVLFDRKRICDQVSVVRMISPVPKPIDSKPAGTLRRHHH